MFFISGLDLFGFIDRMPDGSYVATLFRHFYYAPTLPMSSWLVYRRSDGVWDAVKVRFSFRSLIAAYVRTAPILIAVAALIFALFITTGRHPSERLMVIGYSIVLLGFVVAATTQLLWRHASARRAESLSKLLRTLAANEIPYATEQTRVTRGFDVLPGKASASRLAGGSTK